MKKRMILALVLVFALLCLACSNDADDGTSSSESVSVAETSTESSVDNTSSAESTSRADETSAESDTSSDTSGTDSSTSSNPSESRDTNSETSSDTSTSSKLTEGSENSESSKPSEGSESSDTSSSSGNTNPSQTAHTHSYKTTVVKPTCTEDGYTLHKCSCGDSYTDNEVPATGHEMGYWSIRTVKQSTYTEKGIHERQCNHCGEWMVDEEYDSLWAPPVNDEEEVYRRIIALKEIYPHGSSWDGDTYYDYRYDAWGNPIEGEAAFGYGSDDACQGFANMVSNTAFGLYWGHRTLPKGTYTMQDIRVGDLIYFEGHVVVALEVHDDYIITVDGNNCGDVCWGDENGLLSAIFPEDLESSRYIETRYDPEYF